jgi:hypothetical protein
MTHDDAMNDNTNLLGGVNVDLSLLLAAMRFTSRPRLRTPAPYIPQVRRPEHDPTPRSPSTKNDDGDD